MLDNKLIALSQSEPSSPTVLVPRLGGSINTSSCPVPSIDDCIDHVSEVCDKVTCIEGFVKYVTKLRALRGL